MPSAETHIDQARHNELVAEAMAAAGFHDWAITALFYAALNWMQAYLLEVGATAATHARRQRVMLQRIELEQVLEPYSLLKVLSESARYNCERFDASRYESARSGPFRQVVDTLARLRSQR